MCYLAAHSWRCIGVELGVAATLLQGAGDKEAHMHQQTFKKGACVQCINFRLYSHIGRGLTLASSVLKAGMSSSLLPPISSWLCNTSTDSDANHQQHHQPCKNKG
jgi:hypothetical protein